eukprot:4300017-Ditylum_brightwellii.AAC.1
MLTHQKKKEAFAHVMGTVSEFKNDSPMVKAMDELEYDSIKYIITMDDEEVMRLLYTVKVTKGNKEVE